MTQERESRPDDVQAAPEEFGGSEVKDTKTTAKKAATGTSPKVAQRTQNQIIAEVTADYIAGLDPDDLPVPPKIERELIAATNFAFGAENLNGVQGNKSTLLKTLTFSSPSPGTEMARSIRPIPRPGRRPTDSVVSWPGRRLVGRGWRRSGHRSTAAPGASTTT